MSQRLAEKAFYRIRDPKNFYAAMRSDVELLLFNRRYVSLTTIVLCCCDALAAGSGRASSGKFERFVKLNFPGLCGELDTLCAPRLGAKVLYDGFRNGFSHLRIPKETFAIAEDHELAGRWAGRIAVENVGEFNAINVDRLASEFIALLVKLESQEKSKSKGSRSAKAAQ